MAHEQRDELYGRRIMFRGLMLIGLLMLVGLCVVPQIEQRPVYLSPVGWVLVSVWLVILVAGIFWTNALKRNYRCPKCGRSLPMMQREASTQYEERFYCPDCGITWTTGVYPGDGEA